MKRLLATLAAAGTFFLAVFLIVPIILTIQTAFTNFGDGHRGTKEEAINAIVANAGRHAD